MPSETDIANLALQHLGESRINSIEDTGDKVSRTCKVNFAQARDEALQSARWGCAKTQAALSKLAQAPLYKWRAAYQLPADFIRLIEIEGEDAWTPKEYFDRQGNKLLIGRGEDAEDMPDSINIEYISRVEDTTLFDPLLVESIAMLLAMKCARALTGSDSKQAELRKEYEQVVLPRAMTLNAQPINSGANHPIRQMMAKSFMNRARHTGGFGGFDAAAYPPSAQTPVAEEISDWSEEIV